MNATLDLDRAMHTAKEAAQAAAEASLRYWKTGLQIERKADNSPVTQGDKAAEAAILDVIRRDFPEHSILAEESGRDDKDSPYRWIIDPIDGTRGFTRGGQFWGALVGLEGPGGILAGAMALPALGDLYWAARGLGCFHNGERVQINQDPGSIAEATLSLGELSYLLRAPWQAPVLELIQEAELARCYGDLKGPALLLSGMADAWLEAGVQPWDLGPIPILIEEAGGVCTAFSGQATIHDQTALAAPKALHALLLARLQNQA